MSIRESGEDYLETILILKNENSLVRSIDIANKLGYSKPSVSRAMGILKDTGYICVEAGGNIVLTDKGLKKATEVYERHRAITVFIEEILGVSSDIAVKDACRIEHIISPETFEGIKRLIDEKIPEKAL